MRAAVWLVSGKVLPDVWRCAGEIVTKQKDDCPGGWLEAAEFPSSSSSFSSSSSKNQCKSEDENEDDDEDEL